MKSNTTLSEQAYKILEEKIIKLELKPGEFYSENDLSDLIGIGRMPTREAIKQLSMAHLVRIMPRRGIMITELKSEEIYLQFELRTVLERLLVSRATRLASQSEKQYFLDLADRYEQATMNSDDEAAIKIDDEFNTFLSECARNPFAAQAIAPLYALSRRIYYFQYNVNEELTKEINLGHIKLMRSIAAGNENDAIENFETLMKFINHLNQQNLSSWYS
ncbi:GntR family transcriptional regulator [Bacillus sp. Marseille-P3661]|uniref:GntR family transcriptional regulator n=1 Tax=Bacillus sp. Marseille-P3661 TaxID=1936234 RepID=UPI000C850B4C|nr:GntR family transcriptional regulator [Bacillus sp. Marseille-P3661]